MSYGKVDVKEEKTSFRTKNIKVKFVNDQFTDLKDQIYLMHQVYVDMDDINSSFVELFIEAKLYRAKGDDVDRYDL